MAFFGLYGSTAALATTLTLATAINCIGIGIGFQRGTHTRWQLVADGTGAPTPTDMGGKLCHCHRWRADPVHRGTAQREFGVG